MKHWAIIPLLLMGGCSTASFYPVAGSIGGAAIGGAVGGVPGGAVGAGLGYGAGKMGKLAHENKELVKSLSKGDVEGMLAASMGKQKGFVEEALDTLYGFIKLCLVLLVLWQLVPLAYTRFIHKKATNGTAKKT